MEHPHTLDHESDYVLDVRDLSRRPGTMREVARDVPAPSDLGAAVISVPEGSELELNLRLESVMEGVFVSGTVEAEAVGECVRCLEEVLEPIDVHIGELFCYPEKLEAAAESGDEDEAEETFEVVDEMIDLEPALRDAVVMALPFQPVCDPDCLGLCSECGVRLSDPGNEDHAHEILDPRWKALEGLASTLDSDSSGEQ